MGILSNLIEKIFPKKAEAQTPPPTNPTAQASVQTPVTEPIDIRAHLSTMAKTHGEKLNWETSIVDLMKLVGMDSSFANRKELAKELNYTGDTNDSASMNIWLHKQVMQKISQNGGKVPPELLN